MICRDELSRRSQELATELKIFKINRLTPPGWIALGFRFKLFYLDEVRDLAENPVVYNKSVDSASEIIKVPWVTM